MRRIARVAVVVCSLTAFMAAPGLATPSTLIWIPSTDIQGNGVLHQGADVYAGSAVKPLYDNGLTYGGSRLEYGIDYLNTPTGRAVWFNGKLLLTEEKASVPRVAVGVYNVGKKEDGAPNFLYLVASKTTKAARFHAGVCTGSKSVLLADQTQLLLGVDKQLNSKWWAAVDYQSGKSAFGALSVGAAYNVTPNVSVIAGRDFYNDSSLPDTWTLQWDVNY